MSPRIEDEPGQLEVASGVNYFTVDLAVPTPFDVGRFKELAKLVSYDDTLF